MHHDHDLKKLNFDIMTAPKGNRGGCLCAKCLLPCCWIRSSLQFDMQHDHVLKKVEFDLLILKVVRGVEGWGGVSVG